MATYGFTVNVEGNVQAQMNRMAAAMEKMNVTASTVTKQTAEKYEMMGAKIRGVFDGIKNLILPSLGLGVLFGGFEFISKAVEHTNALNKAMTDLHQTYLTMHGAMHLSEADLAAQADKLDKLTVFSKPAIISAQAMLATFREVKGSVFTSTMDSVADYAAKFMGGDMVSAAKSLGIAINSPLIGMTRLRRQGISFTEEQKKQIKNLVAQGHLMQAQQIILREVKSETGGQAQAYAQTDAGKQELAKKQWDEVYVRVGNIVNRIKADMIPLIGKIADVFMKVLDWLSKNRDMILNIIRVVGGAVAGYLAYKIAVEAITIATEAWKNMQLALDAALSANPIGLIVTGIGLLTGAFFAMQSQIDKTTEANEKLKMSLGDYIKQAHEESKATIYNIADKYQYGVKGVDKHGNFTHYSKKEQDVLIAKDIEKQKDLIRATYDFSKLKGPEKLKASTELSHRLADYTFYKDIIKNRAKDNADKGGSGSASKDDALSTQNLSGAKGGLGQAKIINIKIDTVMKVETHDNHDLKKHAETGAQYILRTINNIAEGQTATQ